VFIRVEAVAAALASFLAAAILTACLTDWIGLTIAPLPTLAASFAVAALVFIVLWRGADGGAADGQEIAAFVAIVAGLLIWLLWLAGRSLLPPGSGPDLTHHLLLIGYIEQHWRLPRDPQLGAYLGEMLDYTPGSQLLAALAGAWARTDGLHALYPMVAFTVALKSGVVFLVARRLMPAGAPRVAPVVIAVLLLLLPRAYFVGSFAQHSFLAQVVSECFALAMWWALIVWDERPTAVPLVLFALFGAATYLTWPVWIGPPLIVFAICVFFRRDLSIVERATQFALALAAIGAAAALHSAGRTRSFGIAAVAGFVLRPAPAVFGWAFLLVCGAGVCVGLFGRRTRTIPLLLGAIALQAEALYVFAHARGSAAPYLALKMTYLAIYPLAVAGAVGVASLLPRLSRRGTWQTALAWGAVALFAVAAGRSMTATPRPTATISEPLIQAGQWARAHVDSNCVDYLVSDGYSAYWLHLAVLGNARSVKRSTENDTYEPRQALIRWIEPSGLPYAIADDFSALPKDIRDRVDILARFGPAAVVKRRGPGVCPAS
jgi:hypothetical protein